MIKEYQHRGLRGKPVQHIVREYELDNSYTKNIDKNINYDIEDAIIKCNTLGMPVLFTVQYKQKNKIVYSCEVPILPVSIEKRLNINGYATKYELAGSADSVKLLTEKDVLSKLYDQKTEFKLKKSDMISYLKYKLSSNFLHKLKFPSDDLDPLAEIITKSYLFTSDEKSIIENRGSNIKFDKLSLRDDAVPEFANYTEEEFKALVAFVKKFIKENPKDVCLLEYGEIEDLPINPFYSQSNDSAITDEALKVSLLAKNILSMQRQSELIKKYESEKSKLIPDEFNPETMQQ